MIKQSTISVIIPAYNCEKYISECLFSLEAQTYKNFEVIIVDDGSTDKTPDIVQSFHAHSDIPIRFYSQPNRGASAARNNGMEHARGDFIAFIDADDYVYSDYFEVLMSNFNESIDIVTCGYQKFDTETGAITYTRNTPNWEISLPNGESHLFQYSPSAKIIRRSLIEDNCLRFVEGEVMEDGPFGIMTNSLSRSNIAIPYLGYRYRVRSGSVQDSVRKGGLTRAKNGRAFPAEGLRKAIEVVKTHKGADYEFLLEYVIAKALAGFVFSASKQGSREDLHYICEYCTEIFNEFFPEIHKNPYIRLNQFRNLPLSHRAATLLLVRAHKNGTIFRTAQRTQSILKHMSFLK